jgi:hypothetical protein
MVTDRSMIDRLGIADSIQWQIVTQGPLSGDLTDSLNQRDRDYCIGLISSSCSAKGATGTIKELDRGDEGAGSNVCIYCLDSDR